MRVPGRGRARTAQAHVHRENTATSPSAVSPRVARFQMPAVIEFRTELPYTPLGKPDKKALRGEGG